MGKLRSESNLKKFKGVKYFLDLNLNYRAQTQSESDIEIDFIYRKAVA